MGYSIVFKTKFVKLSDGRYLFLQRNGCNNDEEGRKKNTFNIVEVKTENEIYNMINRFKHQYNNRPFSECNCFELIICGRKATYYDYGDHLLRMLKRAETYEDFVKNNMINISYIKSFTLLKPYVKELSLEEFYEEVKGLNGGYTYGVNTTQVNPCDETEVVRVIFEGVPIEIYVKKKK